MQGSAEGELRERASRFFASRPSARPRSRRRRRGSARCERRFPDAARICFAWRVGWPPGCERATDAGEPAAPAGAPILRALQGGRAARHHRGRGALLRRHQARQGRLARAYRRVPRRLALAALPTRLELPRRRLRLRVPYDRIGAVKRLVRAPEVELASESYLAAAEIVLAVVESALPSFLATLEELGLEAEPVETPPP